MAIRMHNLARIVNIEILACIPHGLKSCTTIQVCKSSRVGFQGNKKQLSLFKKNKSLKSSRKMKFGDDRTDWPSVHPAPQSLNMNLIPLPIKMGRQKVTTVTDDPVDAAGNIGLLKIPNFFHLTPPAIQRHCEALKEYCTMFPADVSDKPVRITTINYLYDGPSVRHPDSRKVKLQIYLKDLSLDDHGKNKLIRLAGHRYNPNTEELTLIADKCPTRKQNKEYAYYLLTALYHEASKVDDWENEVDECPTDEVELELQKVRHELCPKLAAVQNAKKRTFHRIVGDKLVVYNDVGHPFLVQWWRRGLKGLLSKEHLEEAREEWKKIQKDIDDYSTFDKVVHDPHGSPEYHDNYGHFY